VDDTVRPAQALALLRAGNDRYMRGEPTAGNVDPDMRRALVEHGQAPHTAIIGCADSRCPLETLFDAMPGDLFVMRNAGNTCTHAEGSMVGSLEFCTGVLKTQLVLVLGHTKCGAIVGATKAFLDRRDKGEVKGSDGKGTALQCLLQDLGSVAQQATAELGPDASADDIAAHAIKVNVFHSMNFLLRFSEPIREKVRNGELEIHGGIYHLDTGSVEMLGMSPLQEEVLASKMLLPPSMAGGTVGDTSALRGIHGVRTAADGTVLPGDALKLLKEGNQRFAAGAPIAQRANSDMRSALVEHGQAPHTAIIGCADSRCPLETLFDAMPGDLFVLRNAGNTCTHAEGSMVGSLEFCTGVLKTKLVLVLGHTKCGAIVGATNAYFAEDKKANKKPSSALNVLLSDLEDVAKQAHSELGDKASETEVANHAIEVNVFHTINFLLKFSEPIRRKVAKGELEIQGAVYHLETGRVDFLGKSPAEKELLSAKDAMPRTMGAYGGA